MYNIFSILILFSLVFGLYKNTEIVNSAEYVTTPISTFAKANNGAVRTMVLSSNNSILYVGGSFTNIRSNNTNTTRNRLAAIDTTTGFLTSFNPNVGGGDILSMALSPDGNTLYIAGEFSTVGGVSQFEIASIDTTTGIANSWNPQPSGGQVYSVAVSSDGNTVYAGGHFSDIGGYPRDKIAAIDATSAIPTSWDPGSTGNVHKILLSSDNSTVYVTGEAGTIGGAIRSGIAALSTSTGLATSWDPGGEKSYGMVLNSAGTTLYVVGDFTSIGGQSRNYIAALDTTTGLATSWDPGANNPMRVIALSPDESMVYVGALSTATTTIGGATRNGFASIYTSTGVSGGFNPAGGSFGDFGSIVISSDSSYLYSSTDTPDGSIRRINQYSYGTPIISSISTTTMNSLASPFTMTISGSYFGNSSVVRINGVAKTTTFVSDTTLTVPITSAELLNVGFYSIYVVDPGPKVSNPKIFSVHSSFMCKTETGDFWRDNKNNPDCVVS